MSDTDQKPAEPIAYMEAPHDRIILWQDFTDSEGYRAKLTMLHFRENGERVLELSCGGTVSRLKYVFSFSEKDRL